MKKKFSFFCIFAVLVLSFQICAFGAQDSTMGIVLNGQKLDASALSEGENIYLPVRAISEQLGFVVNWLPQDSQINISKGDKYIMVGLKNYVITSSDLHTYYMYMGDGVKVIGNTAYAQKGFFEEKLGLKITQDNLNNTILAQSVLENQITISNQYETSNNDGISVKINYPQISSSDSTLALDKVNAVLKQVAQDARDQGIATAQKMQEDMKGYDGPAHTLEVNFDYRIKYNQNNMLSIILLNYQYMGGAHGSTIQSSYTFDLKTGQALSLKDLLKPDSGYVMTFNDIVNSEIVKRQLYLLNKFESIKDDQGFYLSNEGVNIYFQQYEYFPYAAGIQSFCADYYILKDMLNTDYAILYDNSKILSTADENILNVGQDGEIILKGNPTTGYTWQYTISDDSVIKLDSQVSAADSGLVGAGSTFFYKFTALKPGQVKITFKYYRDWEKDTSVTAQSTLEYIITVNPSDAIYNAAPFYQSKIVYETDDGL